MDYSKKKNPKAEKEKTDFDVLEGKKEPQTVPKEIHAKTFHKMPKVKKYRILNAARKKKDSCTRNSHGTTSQFFCINFAGQKE